MALARRKLEVYQWTFNTLLKFKIYWHILWMNCFLPRLDFVASFVKCWHTLFYDIGIITFINMITDLIRKVFTYWEAVQFKVADTIFPKILIFLWKVAILILTTNATSCFPWNDSLALLKKRGEGLNVIQHYIKKN